MIFRKKQKRSHPTTERKSFLLDDQTAFVVQEAYKSLRTNVIFALPGSSCKCIGITSSMSGDGKSTTAVNLAISLAQIGKKVLLIDCDLRLPTIAAKMGIRPSPGLSDFLIGAARIDEAICNVTKFGIHVLPASDIPADPTGLLESRQMEHLFSALRRNYEFVIVDLPPVTAVSDALILSRCLDGFLLIIAEKRTEHRAVAEMLRRMRMAKAKVLGFVNVGSKNDDSNVYKKDYQYAYKKK